MARAPAAGWERSAAGEPADVHLAGTVFLDLVFAGLTGLPDPGTEVYAPALGTSPGGVATVAVALARLGLRVRLTADFADDVHGRYLRAVLAEAERVDLTGSRVLNGWTTPVTVSIVDSGDRRMITHVAPGGADRVGGGARPDRSRAGFGYLDADPDPWWRAVHERGGLVFVDTRWDERRGWPRQALDCLEWADVFLPNAGEAMAYAGADSPTAALRAFARTVPTVVVKCGPHGAIGTEHGGPVESVPALELPTVDPTGAGDVFDAGFIYGTLAGWPLRQRLRFATLCAGLSLARPGGALSAPDWPALRAWRAGVAGHDDGWDFLAAEGPPPGAATVRDAISETATLEEAR